MTVHQLRIFTTTAKYLNLTRAAQELHISQPSISHQLKLLEEACGAKLYRATSRGIELTKEGRLFLTEAEPLLLQLEKLEKFSRNLTERSADSLAVGCCFSQSASLLPQLSAAFKKTHPNVQLTLRIHNCRTLEQLVLHSEIDIALITIPSDIPSLVYEALVPMDWVIFASLKHPLAKKRRVMMVDLAGVPFVNKLGPRAHEILGIFQKRNTHLNIVIQANSHEAVKAIVMKGVGLGILSKDVVEPEINRGELKIIQTPEFKMQVNTSVIWHQDKPLSPNAQAFHTLLRQLAQK